MLTRVNLSESGYLNKKDLLRPGGNSMIEALPPERLWICASANTTALVVRSRVCFNIQEKLNLEYYWSHHVSFAGGSLNWNLLASIFSTCSRMGTVVDGGPGAP
jgi:hypothetical protein